jgi:hypothetical protein
MDAALCVALLAAPTAGATPCPKAGVAAAAANDANKSKSRCLCMPTPVGGLAPSAATHLVDHALWFELTQLGGPDLARLRLNRTQLPNIKAALGIQITFGDAAIQPR